jgi:endonuclease-3
MQSKKRKSIDKVMRILEKYFNYKTKTTLNRMRDNPEPFKILIACLLSLRTQDKNTENVSQKLFAVASTPKQIANLPLKKLEKLIYSSGFYKNKARTIKHVSKVILEKYKGKVPNTEKELLSIKGIGRKTANVVLNFAFNKPALPIDTHCHHIPNKLGWIKTSKPEETERALEKLLLQKYWKEFNAIFVLFGKTICVPISPFCSKCPVNEYCRKINVVRSR